MDNTSNGASFVLIGSGLVGEPPERGTSQRLFFVDLLNVISCFAVVALHVSLPVFTPEPTSDWMSCVGLQAASIFAVPVFFMISGMNLLGYRDRYSTRDFFFKRFRRVGAALMGGSLLCYLLFGFFPDRFYGTDAIVDSFGSRGFINLFATNGINSIYWFLYEILYLYLLTPLLSLTIKRRNLLRYLLALCLVAGIGVPFLEYLQLPSSYFGWLVNWPLFSSTSLFYFLLGGYIGAFCRRPNAWGIVWSSLAYIASAFFMFHWSLRANGYPEVISNFYLSFPISTKSPLCVVQAISVFMLAAGLEEALRRNSRIHGPLIALSKASLGVYLIHIVFIDLLPVGRLTGFVTWMSRSKLLKLAVVWLCSALISLCWQRIKKWFLTLDSSASQPKLKA